MSDLSPLAQQDVLVTGGGGFIGSHLVEQLVQLGTKVTVVDNLSTGHQRNIASVVPQIKLIVGDLADLLKLNQINLHSYQIIYHLAANPYIPTSVENPVLDYELNLRNTFMLLEALRSTNDEPYLINISSAAVYGNPASLPIRETDATVPISPYGVSKLAAERYAAIYSQIYGVRATSLRFFSVYGPRQRKQVVYDMLRKLRADPTQIEILGDGSQSRDFTYVQDIVQAVLLASIKAPGNGEVYNVASGKTHTIAELISAWCEVCNVSPEIVYTGKIRSGDVQEWVVDISCLEQLGYKARISLVEGLVEVRNWYDADGK